MKRNEIGNRYGRLLVVAESERRGSDGAYYWECVCDCGNTRLVYGSRLRRGHTQSCGCFNVARIRETHRKAPGHSGLTRVELRYKYIAKKVGRDFTLSREDFALLTKQNCYYCGVEPNQKSRISRRSSAEGNEHTTYVYNGLDRVDSLGGYTLNNVVPCCGLCNRIKSDTPTEELFTHLERMVAHYNRGK